jgi:hypothetical protein
MINKLVIAISYNSIVVFFYSIKTGSSMARILVELKAYHNTSVSSTINSFSVSDSADGYFDLIHLRI